MGNITELQTEAEWEELEDDPNEPEVIVDLEAIAQASADYKAGLLKTVSWEDLKAELHVED